MISIVSRKQMKLLKRLFGFSAPEGARLEGPAWKLSAPKDIPVFIRAIPDLTDTAIIYLEASPNSKSIAKVLTERSVTPELDVARGTIWPKPILYHVPADPDNIEAVATLFESHIPVEVCSHFHIYANGKILLEWHDAFFNDPFFVSKIVSEDKLTAFASEIGCSVTEASLSG
jgi:hypothetical protein